MATRTLRWSEFSGGEYGDLGPTGAEPTMFTGTNVMVYNDGTIGPRPGLKQLQIQSLSAGPIWTLRGLGYGTSNGQVYGQGSTLYGFTFTTTATVAAIGTVSTTVTTNSQMIQYGPNIGELARYGDKLYQVAPETPLVTPLPSSPGALTLTPYGIRLMAANGAVTTTVTASVTATAVTAKRVYYSAAADLTSWPALNYFDVGNISWPVSYLDELRQRLIISTGGGEFWALSGTPGVNDSLKRQPRGDLSGAQWYHHARVGETVWFFPSGEDFPVQFTGIVVDKLRFRHLRFTGGSGTDWSMTALPVAEMLLALEDGGSGRGLLLANDVWTYHDFGVTTSRYCTPPSVGGSGADLDMPLVLSDGGSAGAAPVFWTFAPTLSRPAKVSDTWAQPGDASTTPVDASFSTSLASAKPGHRFKARRITVHGLKWNTGSSSTNHFDLKLRSFYRSGPPPRGMSSPKDSKTFSWDEAASLTTSDKTPFSVTFTAGDQQLGDQVQCVISSQRGCAIEAIEVDADEEPRG